MVRRKYHTAVAHLKDAAVEGHQAVLSQGEVGELWGLIEAMLEEVMALRMAVHAVEELHHLDISTVLEHLEPLIAAQGELPAELVEWAAEAREMVDQIEAEMAAAMAAQTEDAS